MKIYVINDRGSLGGASIAANRINQALMSHGHHLGVFTSPYFRIDSDSGHILHRPGIQDSARDSIATLIRKRLKRRFMRHKLAESLQSYLAVFDPDVIHIHNLHGFREDAVEVALCCASFSRTIWTLHDMWAITGGLPYIPTSEPPKESKLSEVQRNLYKRANNLVFVAPSKWLKQETKSRVGDLASTRQIKYPLHTDILRPLDKELSRDVKRINENSRFKFITVAQSFREPRKGLRELLDAIRIMKQPNIEILAMGQNRDLGFATKNCSVQFLGSITNLPHLALCYNCADVLVHPALADNQPLVIMEAMSCGLPVIAFPVGGVPEMVEDGVTGWLADEVSPEALAKAIQRALDDREKWPEFGNNAREFVKREYNPDVIAKRYEALYNAMVNEAPLPTQDELEAIR